MTIFAEVTGIASEFIPGKELFSALLAQEGVNDYQLAQWFQRNWHALEQCPMYEFSPEYFDYMPADDGLEDEILNSYIYPVSNDISNWEAFGRTGYICGWLKSDLEAFFRKTSVKMPDIRPPFSQAEVQIAGETTGATLPRPPVTPTPERNDVEELHPKERTTALCIIGALALQARYDLSRPSKSATALIAAADFAGIELSQRTAENWLKQVPAAMERRAKS